MEPQHDAAKRITSHLVLQTDSLFTDSTSWLQRRRHALRSGTNRDRSVLFWMYCKQTYLQDQNIPKTSHLGLQTQSLFTDSASWFQRQRHALQFCGRAVTRHQPRQKRWRSLQRTSSGSRWWTKSSQSLSVAPTATLLDLSPLFGPPSWRCTSTPFLIQAPSGSERCTKFQNALFFPNGFNSKYTVYALNPSTSSFQVCWYQPAIDL